MTTGRVDAITVPTEWDTGDDALDAAVTRVATQAKAEAVAAGSDRIVVMQALHRAYLAWQASGADVGTEVADLVQEFLGALGAAACGLEPAVAWEELVIGAPTLQPAAADAVAMAMAAKLSLPAPAARARLEAVIAAIRASLQATQEASLPGLGQLQVRRRRARIETRDGVDVEVPQPAAVVLKPSRSGRDALAQGRPITALETAGTPVAEALARQAGIDAAAAAASLGAAIDGIGVALASPARSVALPGLGLVAVVTRRAREGQDPKTGEVITIPAQDALGFLVDPDLRRALTAP